MTQPTERTAKPHLHSVADPAAAPDRAEGAPGAGTATPSSLAPSGLSSSGSDLSAEEAEALEARGVKVAVFVLAGAIAGIAGMTQMTLSRMANPFDLVGQELNVIAAVVLGGARITGGHGTITGTMLGVLVITMINTSLLMIGVPSYWQKVVVGSLIIIGTALPIAMERWQTSMARRKA